jgi:hypothetical protein
LAAGAWRVAIHRSNSQEKTLTDTSSAEEPAGVQRSQTQTPRRSDIPEGPPPAHAGWAIVTLLFFWPLSFAAFNHAFAVYPLWAGGDADAARYRDLGGHDRGYGQETQQESHDG